MIAVPGDTEVPAGQIKVWYGVQAAAPTPLNEPAAQAMQAALVGALIVVALKVPAAQFEQVRLRLIVPGLLMNVPKPHVASAVQDVGFVGCPIVLTPVV